MPTQSRKKPPPQTTKDYLVTLMPSAPFPTGITPSPYFGILLSSLLLPSATWPIPATKQRARRNTSLSSSNTNLKSFSSFHPCSACSSRAWSRETTDVLGMLYHRLELHNHQSQASFSRRTRCVGAHPLIL